MPLLPTQGGSPGTWGTEVNNYLLLEHNTDGTHKFPITLQVKAFDDASVVTTGDGSVYIVIPANLNGRNLTAAHAYVSTVSTSATPTVQLRRVRAGTPVDMLSTKITIDANEVSSYTAAAPPVINVANDDVATGDVIGVDVDLAGTGAKGLGVILTFQ